MNLLNSLLSECIKRFEMAACLPYKGMDENSRSCLEDTWAKDDYRRMIYYKYCDTCIRKYDCKLISFRHWTRKNVIINYFGGEDNSESEIIVYKDDLKCIDDQKNIEFKGGSNYIEIDGILFPKDKNLRNSKFLENMANSLRQSLDRYWGYALSNEWDYFVTLTTNRYIVGDRYDDELIKELWRNCRRRLQYYDKGVKILLTPERHKDGALHFHGFVSMDRAFILKEARDPHTNKLMYSNAKTPLFEFPFWDYGMSTCAVIKMDKEQTYSQRRLAAYLVKYVIKANGLACGDVTKSSEVIGYKQKRFYHTENLIFKTKDILYLDNKTISAMTDEYEQYKETDSYIIYRLKPVIRQ